MIDAANDLVRAFAGTSRRALLAPGGAVVVVLAGLSAWVGARLAAEVLGSEEGFLDEVRASSLLAAATLAISLAEPLEIGREARDGLLHLRVRHGRPGLVGRCLGLIAAALPAMAAAALAGGAWPAAPVPLLASVLLVASAGLALGAVLERALLVPALWLLVVAAHARDWLLPGPAAPLAWLLPRLDAPEPVHALLWSAGALVLADALVRRRAGS